MEDRDQIWAEAVERWKEGEPLYLSPEMGAEAKQRQAEYNDDNDDPLKNMVQSFLDMKLPPDWVTWDLNRRRAYIKNPDPLDEEATDERDKVCAAEFICEMLGRDMADKEYKYLARKVCKIIDGLDGWERVSITYHATRLYGKQKGFKRKIDDEEDEI